MLGDLGCFIGLLVVRWICGFAKGCLSAGWFVASSLVFLGWFGFAYVACFAGCLVLWFRMVVRVALCLV